MEVFALPKVGPIPSLASSLMELWRTDVIKVNFCRGMAGMSMFLTESSRRDMKTLHHKMTSHIVDSGHTHRPLTLSLHGRISELALEE